jgi:MinD superfamily P-loop ATPase
MKPGEENSGKLVAKLRTIAREKAKTTGADYIVNDGPPGIGCAPIASVTGADLVIMVIEASKSGFHDFKRAAELVQSFNTPIIAVINKYNINTELTDEIVNELETMGIDHITKVPFDRSMIDATMAGLTYPEFATDNAISEELNKLKTQINCVLNNTESKNHRENTNIKYL